MSDEREELIAQITATAQALLRGLETQVVVCSNEGLTGNAGEVYMVDDADITLGQRRFISIIKPSTYGQIETVEEAIKTQVYKALNVPSWQLHKQHPLRPRK